MRVATGGTEEGSSPVDLWRGGGASQEPHLPAETGAASEPPGGPRDEADSTRQPGAETEAQLFPGPASLDTSFPSVCSSSAKRAPL